MREQLKRMDLKITELAQYLDISRPTMYKYIDAYEAKDYSAIDKEVLSLFRYIEKNDGLIVKRNVVSYILQNISVGTSIEEKESSKLMKEYASLLKKEDPVPKKDFIASLLNGHEYDKIIPYLNSIKNLINKKKLSPEEEELLKPIALIYEKEGLSSKPIKEKETNNGK